MMYDPGADAADRYPDVTIRHRLLGGVPAALSPNRRVILIERTMDRRARRCALAHEVAHLDLGHGIPLCEGREERRADETAASRLIPLDRLADVLRWALSPDEVAHDLDVTPHLARVRIRSLSPDEKAWIEDRIAGEERGIA
jgi:hypothetical protein